MSLDAARILITGGCGQIGIAIAQYLQTQHPSTNIFILDIKTPSQTSPQYMENITYYAGDITDSSTISRILGNVQPQIVFHTAGIVPSVAQRLGLNNEEGFMRVNVEGTRNVVDECRRVGSVRAFVFTSSADVVKGSSWVDLRGVDERWPIPGKFDGLYAKSKAIAESHVLSTSSTSFPTTALRAHAVFSAHDTNILPLLLSTPRNVHMGSGKNLYDFTYAPNLAHAHVLAAINLLTIQPAEATNYYSAAGKPFFVTNAEPCYFRTFITAVWKANDAFEGNRDSGNSGYSSGGSVGVERPIKKGTSIPKNVAVPFVWMSEKVSKISGKKPMLTTKELGDSMAERFFDNTRAKEVFEYVPMVKLADAIRESVGGYKRIQKWEGRAGGDLGGNVNT